MWDVKRDQGLTDHCTVITEWWRFDRSLRPWQFGIDSIG